MAGEGQKTIYMWARPRSLSTAFVRAMSTLEGCKAINEPYLDSYFTDNKIKIPGIPQWYGKTRPEVRENISKISGNKILFIKEMPSHLGDDIHDVTYVPEDAVHTFLIRHPVKTTNSYVRLVEDVINAVNNTEEAREDCKRRRLSPAAIEAQQSFTAMSIVYDTVVNRYGHKPIIIDADDIQRNPEGTLRAYCNSVGIEYQDSMVNWGKITPEQRKIFEIQEAVPGGERAHSGPIEGTSFIQSEPQHVTVDDVRELYRDMVRENTAVYEKLREHRIKPVEQ